MQLLYMICGPDSTGFARNESVLSAEIYERPSLNPSDVFCGQQEGILAGQVRKVHPLAVQLCHHPGNWT
jgi:hypothetical protein